MATFEPARLNRVDIVALDAVGYRNQTPGFDPRSGEGARRFGGRFNPPKSFPVIYLCLTRRCVVAELMRQTERQSVQLDDVLPRELWSVAATLTGVLDLTNPASVRATGLDKADLVRADHAYTQQIGEAAHERGIQAIKSSSVTGVDEILALFPENLGAVVVEVDLIETWSTTNDVTR